MNSLKVLAMNSLKENSLKVLIVNSLKEYEFQINNILFEYSIINVQDDLTAWCTSSDSDINIIMPYFQTSNIIINYLKELGIDEKDLIEIEKMTFEYLT
jgi:hypothetical protein